MVQLNILSGEYQHQFVNSNTFPLHIGRGENCHLQLVDKGVWENHLELT